MNRKRSVDTLNLNEVRTRFDNWRRSRHGKQRIPDELWLSASWQEACRPIIISCLRANFDCFE